MRLAWVSVLSLSIAASAGAQPAETDCSWRDVRVGERVRYQLTRGGQSASVELEVVARQGVRAWADVTFRGVRLPEGMPSKFSLEIHTGPDTPIPPRWSEPHESVRASSLAASGRTFHCQDQVRSSPAPQHLCLQPAPTCLFWLDGLVRRTRGEGQSREALELVDFAPPSAAGHAAKPHAEFGEHFSGTWLRRIDASTAERVRYTVEGGQLVREVSLLKATSPNGDPRAGGQVATSQRTIIPFRAWLLSLLDEKPLDDTWIPARSAPGMAFESFPD